MKIRRVVNGVEVDIRLTDGELEAAYSEHKEKSDKEWMREIFRDYFADSWEEFTPKMEEAAYTQYLDEVSEAEFDVMNAAIFDALGKYGKERED